MNEDRASRYNRIRRRTSALSTATVALLLLLLLATGSSAALRDIAAVIASGSFSVTVVVYVAILIALVEFVRLPFVYSQAVTLERRYGLSAETTSEWWWGHLKSGLLALLVGVVAAEGLWHLLRVSPEWWWVTASIVCLAALVLLARFVPLLLQRADGCRPLDRPALRARLVRLAVRTGADVGEIYEWRTSGRSRRATASLAGFGQTRRILLSDTLLMDNSDDEVEVIVAHELAHHVYRDLWRSLGLEGVLIAAGFYCADLVLERAAGFGFSGKSDVAGLPLVLLTAGVVSLLFIPLVNAVSKAHERRADRYALEMTGNVSAFVSAMQRLGTTNLAEERPSPIVDALFHSHPSVASRVAAANSWAAAQAGS